MTETREQSPARRATKEGVPSLAVEIRGHDLTVEDVARTARGTATVRIDPDDSLRARVEASRRHILDAAAAGEPIYGVTTGFGGMANVAISPHEAAALQRNAIRMTTVGTGDWLSRRDVRATMLLRANSHLHGVSGIRYELIDRMVTFLNEGATPRVPELGSIGASGDLAPLAYIAGAVFGLDDHYEVEYEGEIIGSRQLLAQLELEPLEPEAKEGLAMINGTSVMAGIAANCVYETRTLLALALGAHALFFQALRASNQALHPFIHEHKPHTGQIVAARELLALIRGSELARDELDGRHESRGSEPIQDRYSLRCAPQYLGPVIDALRTAWSQLEVEMNSANDNPLIDSEKDCSYHAGNFLGQYVGAAMDQLRYQLAMVAKHLDAQIALLVSPAFNNGLPPCLVGNQERRVNMGFKALQVSGNSLAPLIAFLANPLAPHFPTHAEEFNQNVNSQGLGAALLSRQSLDLGRRHVAISLLFGLQGAELRSHLRCGHYDARKTLGEMCVPLYEAVRSVLDRPCSEQRPLVWNDDEQFLDTWVAAIAGDIDEDGVIPASMSATIEALAGRKATSS